MRSSKVSNITTWRPVRLGRCLVALLVMTIATVGVAREKPRLEVRPEDDGPSVVAVTKGADGSTRRVFLRHADESVQLVGAGWSPDAAAAFLTWSEGEETTWTSFSTDSGATWSTPQLLRRELLMLEGSVAPTSPIPPVDLRLASSPRQRVFMVQLKSVSLPTFRGALADRGAEVLAFFPNNAHLVRMSASRSNAVRRLEFVERVEPYHPAYRLDETLREWVLDENAADGQSKRVQIVLFEAGTGGGGLQRLASGRPSRVIEMEVDRGQLLQLAGHDAVLWIGPWSPPQNSLDLVRSDSGAAFVEDTLGYCGSGVRGEVLDNGIFMEHDAFGEVVPHGPVGLDDSSSMNREQHGTNTYGIVFSQSGDDAHPDARGLLACAEQGIVGDYVLQWSAGIPLMDHAAELKSEYQGSFLSKSYGKARHPNYDATSVYLDQIAWELDLAITQAQANTASQDSHPEAWAKNVISVGAVRHMDTIATPSNPPSGLLDLDDDQWCGGEEAIDCTEVPLAQCTDYVHCRILDTGICQPNGGPCRRECVPFCASIGPAADGRMKPDVHYWFDAIYTTKHEVLGSGRRVSTMGNFGGTSAATPTVAGILGLYLEMWADNVWGTQPQGNSVFEKQPHASTIKALLINNSQQYPFRGISNDMARAHQGWGRPNVRYAYERAARSFIVDETVPLTMVGQSAEFEVWVDPDETELKVTLVYPDPPGVPSAGRQTVNNLDLIVTAPDSRVYHGNRGLLWKPYSSPRGVPDTWSVDTVENVFVPSPGNGKWTVEVRATEINEDGHFPSPEVDVVFALVVTGADEQGPCTDDADCDDSVFCNGAELCVGGVCEYPNEGPCAPGETCFEELGECRLIPSCPAAHDCGGSSCQPAIPLECSTYSTGTTECDDDGTVVGCPGGIWVTNCACETLLPGTICMNQNQTWECR